MMAAEEKPDEPRQNGGPGPEAPEKAAQREASSYNGPEVEEEPPKPFLARIGLDTPTLMLMFKSVSEPS